MTALNPSLYISDPSVRPFTRNSRVDLTAPDVPILNDEEFVIESHRTKSGEIEVVHALFPYAQERTDVGTPSEAFRQLSQFDANGYFSFSPKVNGENAFNLSLNLNTPRISAGPLTNNDRQIRGGITTVSEQPWIDAQRYNPLFSIPVPSDVLFEVTFAILPPSTVTAAAIPNGYFIGGAGGAGTRRVDFAGVLVAGIVMSQQAYDRVLEEAERGENS